MFGSHGVQGSVPQGGIGRGEPVQEVAALHFAAGRGLQHAGGSGVHGYDAPEVELAA